MQATITSATSVETPVINRAPGASVQDARIAQAKLEKIIETGRASAGRVIENIMKDVPEDRMAPSGALRFAVAPDGSRVELVLPDSRAGMHGHALGQAADRVGMPSSYLNHLLGIPGWGRDLLAHALSESWKNREGRVLIRNVGGETRGILSDRFRRLDSRPIVESLALAAQDRGLVPVDGYALAVKNALKMVLPEVYWVTPTEPVLVGLSWQNSDMGAGVHQLAVFLMRLACLNGMTRENLLREVHLGRQLTDTVFSSRTYELDTQTSVSAVKDLVKGYLSPAKVEETLAGIRAANEKKLSAPQVDAVLRARGLNKGEQDAVRAAYTSADIEMMPAGATTYRLANAISWVANQQQDPARKLDMMRSAGVVLDNAAA